MKYTTLIDCDGVLSDFRDMAIRVIKEHFGVTIPETDNKNWDVFNYQQLTNIKSDIWNYIIKTPGLIKNIKKFDYADELISELRKYSDVICVTTIISGGTWADERIQWLIDELQFNPKNIITADKKYLIEGNVFIDDKPSNVIAWADRWYKEGGIPILWQPPNGGIKINNENIHEIGDVNELFKILKTKLLTTK